MHEAAARCASSDDQESDDGSSLISPRGTIASPPFQRFQIQAETPDISADTSLASHSSPYSQMNSFKSEVDTTDLSPDFLKFRPGLLSQHFSDTHSADATERRHNSILTSPEFPKFRPGLLSQQNSGTRNSSPDFPKFRPGLLAQHNSGIIPASPDFPPMFRPSLLSQQNHNTAPTSPDFPDLRPGLLSRHSPDNTPPTNTSPDFGAGGLPQQHLPQQLHGHIPESPLIFTLRSSPTGQWRNFDFLITDQASPTNLTSPPGYIQPHFKCPVSPLARTSTYDPPRFQHVRSILKTPTNQQTRTLTSPLRRKVLQYNADHLLRSNFAANQIKETNDSTDQPDIMHAASLVTPSVVCLPPTPPMNQTCLTTGSPNSELHTSPSLECTDRERTPPSVTTPLAPSITCIPPTPPIGDQTIRATKTIAGTQLHVHFATSKVKELHHVPHSPPMSDTNQISVHTEDDSNVNEPPNTPSSLKDSAILYVPPTPPTDQLSSPSVEMTMASPLISHQQQGNHSKTSALPTPSPKIPKRYRRRKSVTFEEQFVPTSPLGSHHRSQRNPLSPNSPRYYKRRKSVSSIEHKQKREHRTFTPSPRLSRHGHQDVSLSPNQIRSRQYKHRNSVSRSPHSHLKVPSSHLPSHVYRSIPISPTNYKRRKSVSILTHHEGGHHETSPVISGPKKRRKSVSILTHHEDDGIRTSPVISRRQKRRKSVSILTHHEDDSVRTSPVISRHQKRRKSVSIVTHHEDDHVRTSPARSRHQKRRKSFSILTHHESDHLRASPTNSRYHKRRKSVSRISQNQDHNPLAVPSPHLPVHIYQNASSSQTYLERHYSHLNSAIGRNEHTLLEGPSPQLSSHVHRNVPVSPMNYKRQRSVTTLSHNKNDDHRPSSTPHVQSPYRNVPVSPMNYKRQRSVTTNDDHISSTPPQSPGYFFQKYAPSLFNTRQHDRRKSVLVINQENRLIPLTSPVVKRSSLTSHQRSLPSTPLPRRYARRKSLSVITPRTRRRCESEEQIQVTMEAARFDVTSIYSSKSVMSLAPAAVVNKKPAVGRSVQKLDEEVSPTD